MKSVCLTRFYTHNRGVLHEVYVDDGENVKHITVSPEEIGEDGDRAYLEAKYPGFEILKSAWAQE